MKTDGVTLEDSTTDS
jgi:glucosamine 6-phosphate synthetase-like amidotransferase/phosphosugar isomerase protein